MKKYFMTFLLALSAIFSLSQIAFADENVEFQNLMLKGLNYYKQGSTDTTMYEKAIEQFTMARKYSDNPTPVYNIARAYQHLGRCEEALNYFKEYENITRQIKQYGVNDVSPYVSQLTAQCGVVKTEIHISCSPAETLVSVDDAKPVQCYELTSIPVGQRRLLFQLKGFATATRVINMKADEPRYFEVTMDKRSSKIKETDKNTMLSKPDLSEIDTALLMPSPPILSRGLFWGGIASAAVGTILTVTGGAVAATAYDEKTQKSARGGTYSYYEKNDTKHNAGIALLAIGGAAVITGVTLITIDILREHQYENERMEKLSPYIVFSGDTTAAGIHWTF